MCFGVIGLGRLGLLFFLELLKVSLIFMELLKVSVMCFGLNEDVLAN